MKKSLIALMALAIPASAGVINISASERDWVCNGCGIPPPAGPGQNFIVGNLSAQQYRNWFEFGIPTLPSSLLSATLQLWEASTGDGSGTLNGHGGGASIYTIYGLSAVPLVFTDVTAANPFGSVNTSSASDGTVVSITLNAAGLAAILANQGGNLFIGGINSGETSTQADFLGSHTSLDPLSTSVLSLTVSSVPEPSQALPLVVFGSWALFLRRRKAA